MNHSPQDTPLEEAERLRQRDRLARQIARLLAREWLANQRSENGKSVPKGAESDSDRC
jgi:hypothetical protein